MSDVLRQRFDRGNRLDQREEEVKKRERELEKREKALNTSNEKALKKKVDEWLGKPREQRDLIIDRFCHESTPVFVDESRRSAAS